MGEDGASVGPRLALGLSEGDAEGAVRGAARLTRLGSDDASREVSATLFVGDERAVGEDEREDGETEGDDGDEEREEQGHHDRGAVLGSCRGKRPFLVGGELAARVAGDYSCRHLAV